MRIAFSVATVIFLALTFYLLEELSALAHYRSLIFHRYGVEIGCFAALVFLNLLGAVYSLNRRFFLRDTGRKLSHLDRQLRSRESISHELSRRIAEEE